MSDWQNDSMEQQETAYTVSADDDGADSFQYHTDLRQSPTQQYADRRRHSGAVAAICILMITVLLAAAALFVLRFRVSVHNENGVFGINVKKRSAIISSSEKPNAAYPSVDSYGTKDVQEPYQWNGPKLRVERPAGQSSLQWSQVYEGCSGFVASVSASFSDGSIKHGSGIVISEDGFLITSSHIVLSASELNVTVCGETYKARLIGLDIASDLAVIKIEAHGLQVAEFGSSEAVTPGDELSVIGSTITGSVGIVTGRLSSIEPNYKYRGFPIGVCQIIIPLGTQYSGAPLIDCSGHVIGIINTEIANQYEEAESVDFAVPIEEAKPIIDALLEYGYVAGRPSTGISVGEIPPSYVLFYNYPACIYVTAINENSTAYEAGVRKGDMIISANGVKVESVDMLYEIINGMKAGEELSLELYREREVGTVSFLLMEAAQLAG